MQRKVCHRSSDSAWCERVAEVLAKSKHAEVQEAIRFARQSPVAVGDCLKKLRSDHVLAFREAMQALRAMEKTADVERVWSMKNEHGIILDGFNLEPHEQNIMQSLAPDSQQMCSAGK